MKKAQGAMLVALAVSLGVLTGCGADDPGPAATVASPVPAETTDEVSEPTPTPTPTEDDIYGPTETNARGNSVKAIGQLAGLHSQADIPLVQFTVTGITPNFTCTSEFASPPANGNFIAVDVDITTTPELANEVDAAFSISGYDFKVISSDGTTENDSQGNGYLCLERSEMLAGSFGPAEHATGKIVLDSAHTSGSLVLTIGGGATGWEWAF